MSTNFSQFVAEVQAFPKTMPCCRDLSESTSMVWLLLISVSQDRGICVLHQNIVGEHLGMSHFSAFCCWFQFCQHLNFRWILLLPRQKPGKLFDVDCVSMATCNMRIFCKCFSNHLRFVAWSRRPHWAQFGVSRDGQSQNFGCKNFFCVSKSDYSMPDVCQCLIEMEICMYMIRCRCIYNGL